MNVITYECVVGKGRIHLPEDVKLPENSKVYVVVPGIESPRMPCVRSPRLADPNQAPLFKLEVTEVGEDA